MAELHIEADKLEKAAGKLSDLAASLQEEQAAIMRIRGGIEEGWKSRSSPVFMEEFGQAQQYMERIRREAESLSRELNGIATKAREIEEQNTTGFLTDS